MLDTRCRGRGRRRHVNGRWVALLAVAAVAAAACGDTNSAGKLDAGGDAGPPAGPPQKLLILHTNDIHSHLMGFAPEVDYTPATPNDDATVGGMARLATEIGTAKASAAADGTPVLLLDAGDFMMGTLFEFLATQASSELAMMHALGYDATTIGNHELDWTPHGLAGILQAAVTNNVTIPILSSNMNFSPTDPGDDELQALASAWSSSSPGSVGEKFMLLERIGMVTLFVTAACRIPASPCGVQSSSWFPIVVASYPSACIIASSELACVARNSNSVPIMKSPASSNSTGVPSAAADALAVPISVARRAIPPTVASSFGVAGV